MRVAAALTAFLVFPTTTLAQEPVDAFYSLPLQGMKFVSGEIPQGNYAWSWRGVGERRIRESMAPEVSLDGDGEAYLRYQNDSNFHYLQGDFGQLFGEAKLVVRAKSGAAVAGRVFVPKTDWSGMAELAFSLDPKDAKPEHRNEFLDAKKNHYERLASRDIPGAAWFRHQVDLVKREKGEATPSEPTFQGDVRFRGGRSRDDSIEESFGLFTGGRAIAENLQLDRLMPSGSDAEEAVPLADLEGIKIRAYDWKAQLAGKEPKLDALASFVPADQFALFFPSFEAMTTLLDEAERCGTPILQGLETRVEDAMTKSRYERQLCLEMGALARLLGPQIVEEVAMTASDPYLREGTDVALLFRPKEGKGAALVAYLQEKHKQAHEERQRESRVSESIRESETEYGPDKSILRINFFLRDESRSFSSFVDDRDGIVIVSNSSKQIEKLRKAFTEPAGTLAAQDDYKFFRLRYEKGAVDETAFLMLPDEAIRKWCSPRWRIAESRRLRAAALMAELQAQHQGILLDGKLPGRKRIDTALRAPGGGEFHLDPSGVGHSVYGSLDFLTPIAEIPLEKVTKQEADFYKRWKQGYERNWSNFFDPIAVRFSVKPEKLGLDVSVYPLILGSEYRSMSQVVKKGLVTLPPEACDPHGALLHYAMSIDPEAEPFREISKFVIGMAPQLKPNPLQWLGNSAAVFVDDDPIWAQIAKSKDFGNYFEKHPIRLPVGLWVEVKNPLTLAAFLTGVRSMVNMTAPGMTRWDTIEENGQAYVKITATVDAPRGPAGDDEDMDEDAPAGALRPGQMAIYYVTTPKSFLLTLDEGVLKRYLARQAKDAVKNARPWLGGSYCIQADAKLLETFAEMLGESMGPQTQAKSWSNLPILNEWKRLYPGRDPVEVHREIWGTQLLCAAGGDYVWNAKTHSMESTLCGSPRAPKAEAKLPAVLQQLRYGNFGLSFEEDGLRARAELERAR